MRRTLLAVIPLLTTAANAGAIDIVLGELAHSHTYASQIVAATNNTGYPIRTFKIQCAFYRNRELLAFGRASADNVSDGQTVYVEVVADLLSGEMAAVINRTDCEVVDTIWQE